MADVLIVDDEEDICEFLSDALERIDIGSQFVLTGEEALQLIERSTFKVCVVDMKLSTVVTGLQVVKAIRKKMPSAMIVAMSGYIDQGLKEEAQRSGANEYLEKPVDLEMESFQDKIKTLLSKSRTYYA